MLEQLIKTQKNDMSSDVQRLQEDVSIRKETIDNTKISMDTLFRESSLRIIARIFSGVFGSLILLGAITKPKEKIETKKQLFSFCANRLIQFTTSGVLIGFSLDYTMTGIFVGLFAGIIMVIMNIIMIKKRFAKRMHNAVYDLCINRTN